MLEAGTVTFIFKNHVCTKQELLESNHFIRINSITEKIGDDVENWDKNGQLSLIEAKVYNVCKDKMDDELHNIRIKIIERQDTFWESFANIFGNVIGHIMDNLPMINIPLRLFSGVVKALLPGTKNKKRKLSASR